MSVPFLTYDRMLDLLHVRSVDDLRAETQRLTAALGFDYFMYGRCRAARFPGGDPDVVLLGTYPERWIERYAEQRFDRVAPCFAHLARHAYPLPWSRALFSAAEASGFYEEAVAHGVSAGALSPCAPGAGLGVARGEDADKGRADAIRVLPDLRLLAGFLHAALERLEAPPAEAPRLTRRERECLERAAQGLRDGAIADRLGIAERTVWMHLGNAARKLKARSRAQSVALAVAQGLVRI